MKAKGQSPYHLGVHESRWVHRFIDCPMILSRWTSLTRLRQSCPDSAHITCPECRLRILSLVFYAQRSALDCRTLELLDHYASLAMARGNSLQVAV